MFDQRLTTRLLDYWGRLKKDDVVPDFKKNNPAMVEDLWSQCFVVSIIPQQSLMYKYEYVGDRVKEAYGRDPSGQTVDLKIKQFPNSVVAGALGTVMESKAPQHSEGQAATTTGKMIKYRAILLPFGNEATGLTHVVVGLSYRIF